MIEDVRYCERCQHAGLARMVRNITTSGVSQVYWLHLECKQPISLKSIFIDHKLATEEGAIIDNLPVINNYSGSHLCEV